MSRRIYIVGPNTRAGLAVDCRAALAAASALSRLGFVPFVPRLLDLWFAEFGDDHFALPAANRFIGKCAGLLMMPTVVRGANIPVEIAESLAVPVFDSIAAVAKHWA